jgi:hypothetical protein
VITVRCESCGTEYGVGDYPFCKGGHGPINVGVVDDTVIGGRWCETLGHEPFFYTSKSELQREAARRGLVNVVRKDDAYYATQRKQHDEKLRDTGTPY